MSKYQITKEFTFSAAHRLFGHDGPCGQLHGHTYKVQVTFGSSTLDSGGVVVDSSVIERVVKTRFLCYWDHVVHLNKADPLVRCLRTYDVNTRKGGDPMMVVVQYLGNPTAANMATRLFFKINEIFTSSVIKGGCGSANAPRLLEVTVWETPDTFATYKG